MHPIDELERTVVAVLPMNTPAHHELVSEAIDSFRKKYPAVEVEERRDEVARWMVLEDGGMDAWEGVKTRALTIMVPADEPPSVTEAARELRAAIEEYSGKGNRWAAVLSANAALGVALEQEADDE